MVRREAPKIGGTSRGQTRFIYIPIYMIFSGAGKLRNLGAGGAPSFQLLNRLLRTYSLPGSSIRSNGVKVNQRVLSEEGPGQLPYLEDVSILAHQLCCINRMFKTYFLISGYRQSCSDDVKAAQCNLHIKTENHTLYLITMHIYT